MKTIIRIILSLLGVALLAIAGYIGYLFLDYHRQPDDVPLSAKNHVSKPAEAPYKITTFNIGYGAYPQDYSFFMDGGKYSRAYDRATVEENIAGVADTIKEIDPNFAFLQEVDTEGDRSFHVNEVKVLTDKLGDYNSVFGQNYDSSYLFYPLNDPIGKAKSGILTLSKTPLEDARRYSLPIETDINKFFDLDRAFTLSHTRIAGKHVCLINTHLSAFTKDKKVLEAQIQKLMDKIAEERSEGHAVIVGGDYNHDVLGNSPEVFSTDKKDRTWTHPFPTEKLPEGFTLVTAGLADAKIPSVRSNGEPYEEGQTFISLIDGFIVSDDIIVKKVEVSDLKFEHSDHNPVTMTFDIK